MNKDFSLHILETNILRGPNYWSNTRKNLIVLKLDLQAFEEQPSHLIKDFNYALVQLIPTLATHGCSYKEAGGFIKRLQEGTWLGHVVEHVALELQVLAGMNVSYGRTRSTHTRGVYFVVFEYEIEEAGLLASELAVKLVNTLAQQQNFSSLQDDLQRLKELYLNKKMGPTTEHIMLAAKARAIPTRRIESSVLQLGYGVNLKLINASITNHTSGMAIEFVADKAYTKEILAKNCIPTPAGHVVRTLEELEVQIEKIGFPLVIKPIDSNHGKGISTNINTFEKAKAAFGLARQYSSHVILEKHVTGNDYRILVINFKFVAAARREPPFIIGDGQSSINVLIQKINAQPNRGMGHENMLSQVKVDEVTSTILQDMNLTLETILPPHQKVYLKHAANLSSGGSAEDVTDRIHADNIFLSERIARLTNLDICGIDLIAEDISVPLKPNNGAVIEVNAGPGFRMHIQPSKGQARNVGKPVVDMLFEPNEDGRIPIVAVTGTNGKTTIVRLIAHIARTHGYHVGLTSTDGIYIEGKEIHRGDSSGPISAGIVLQDPIIDFAVLECARGGILRSGLGFDQCSVSVITNVTSDHLELNEIHTVEEMARVKAVVAKSTMKSGTAVLNADDDLVYDMRRELDCNIALFSMVANNQRVIAHKDSGGLVAYLENDSIVIQHHHTAKILSLIEELPSVDGGKARFMVQNILAAALASVASDIPHKVIADAIKSFVPTAESLPGRMTTFNFNEVTVMLDYAHNEAAFLALKHYLKQLDFKKKIGIIAATGDRREQDIIRIGYIAAEIFDEIIIRHDEDNRGKPNELLTSLLTTGIRQCSPNININVISDEKHAIEYALAQANAGDFIFYFPDKTLEAIQYMQALAKQLPNMKVNSEYAT